jgi:hypothetical protein
MLLTRDNYSRTQHVELVGQAVPDTYCLWVLRDVGDVRHSLTYWASLDSFRKGNSKEHCWTSQQWHPIASYKSLVGDSG